MPIESSYTAKSLNDIAEHFVERAEELRSQMEIARTQTKKDELGTQASTWSDAADFLRRTRIVP